MENTNLNTELMLEEEKSIRDKGFLTVEDCVKIWNSYKVQCDEKKALPNKNRLLAKLGMTTDEYFNFVNETMPESANNTKISKWLQLTMQEMSGMILEKASIKMSNVLLSLNEKMFNQDDWLWKQKKQLEVAVKIPDLSELLDASKKS